MNAGRKKLGLALGSGGVRGLAHIGVLKSLGKHGFKVDYIAGCSIGSLVGAMYSGGMRVQEIQNKFIEGKWGPILSLLDPAFARGGLVKGEKTKTLLQEWLPKRSFRSLKIPFVSVCADLLSGKMVRWDKGNLVSAVRASMAIPSLFAPVKYKNYLLVDGGIISPVADDVVREMGADIVVAVNLYAYSTKAAQNEERYKHANAVLERSINIFRHYLAKYSTHEADVIVTPKIYEQGIIGLKSYVDDKKSLRMIKAGEKAMDGLIPQLKKLMGN